MNYFTGFFCIARTRQELESRVEALVSDRNQNITRLQLVVIALAMPRTRADIDCYTLPLIGGDGIEIANTEVTRGSQ